LLTVRKLAVGLVGLVVVVSSGCGSEAGLVPGENPQSTPTERLAAALWERTTDEQRPLLADGSVTFDEYEGAILRVESCLDEAGIQHEPMELRPDGFTLDFTYSFSGFDELRMDRCFNRYATEVATVWTKQHVPTGAEREEMAAEYARCFERAGVDLSGLEPPYDPSFLSEFAYASSASDLAVEQLVSECDAQFWVLFDQPPQTTDPTG
jgi:hypothetical protein